MAIITKTKFQTTNLPRVKEAGTRALAPSGRRTTGAAALHRTLGNAGTARLARYLEAKSELTVGAPGDRYEREADALADRVMTMPEPAVQRQDLEEEPPEVQTQVEEEEEPEVQTQAEEEEEEEPVQAKGETTPVVTPRLKAELEATRGSGAPLSRDVRAFMEPRFGRDFSAVRVHTGARAAALAKGLRAQACTRGADVYFASGKYAPETAAGKRLLAHELAHTVQQFSSRPERVYRKELHYYDETDPIYVRLGYIKHYCKRYTIVTGICHERKPGKLHAGIGSISGIISTFNLFKSRGHKIHAVYFHTHGSPGYIHLPKGGISEASLPSLSPLAGRLEPNARIGIAACAVANGKKGTRFLIKMGMLLLQGGGIICGSTSVISALPFIGYRQPLWGSTKCIRILRFGIVGKALGSFLTSFSVPRKR